MIDFAARFGDNLVRCRKRADLSQDELALLASLHRTEISNLERGLRLARVDTLVKVKFSLEVSAEELLDGSPGVPANCGAAGSGNGVRADDRDPVR